MNKICDVDRKLPKREIIRSRNEFKNIIQHGDRWTGRYVKCFYKRHPHRSVGFTIPRRLGNAVQRNRVKRIMREVYRHHKVKFDSLSLVILASVNARVASYHDLEKDLCQFIQKMQMDR